MRVKALTWEPPRPLRPATPMRITSLAPSTRPEDLVPAMVTLAAAASVFFRKLRRVSRDMVRVLSVRRVQAGTSRTVPLYPTDAQGGMTNLKEDNRSHRILDVAAVTKQQ